jgi:hypothetical protein
MSLRKAVFVVLICAGYAYAAFWTVYFVRSIVGKLLTTKAWPPLCGPKFLLGVAPQAVPIFSPY